MSTALDQYLALEKTVEGLEDEEAEPIRSEMDSLWYSLSGHERDQLDARDMTAETRQ